MTSAHFVLARKTCLRCGKAGKFDNPSRKFCNTCMGTLRKAEMKWAHIKRRYGISKEEYEQLLEKQAGLCAICRDDRGQRWHVDHDHATGKVRGILCHSCNVALGHFRDNPSLLRKAIEYLAQ